MTALCVAMGGFSTLARYDLLVVTVLKSLPVYVLTAGAVFVALSRNYLLAAVVDVLGILGGAVLIAIGLYLEIVAMRMIGLYYHHFKHRFAWSWG